LEYKYANTNFEIERREIAHEGSENNGPSAMYFRCWCD